MSIDKSFNDKNIQNILSKNLNLFRENRKVCGTIILNKTMDLCIVLRGRKEHMDFS